MAEHENSIGESDEWYTPPEIFEELDFLFDLDPCHPKERIPWIPARFFYTKEDDGLSKKWKGMVFMNPPFGGRNGHLPWLEKFLNHGNGIAIVRAYTSSKWWHQYAVKAHCMVFPKGKTKFVKPDGTIGKSPGHGIALLGMGALGCSALHKSNIGWFVNNLNGP